jgi:DNA-binding response OmpR family regulator
MSQDSKTVLVVDDDLLVLATYKFPFEERGYRVLLAENGNIALKHLEAGAVDIVFLDVLMPDKEGLETLLEIKRRFADVPVFVMSGGGTRGKHDFLAVAKKFGATGALKKPVTPHELMKIIDALPTRGSSGTGQRVA